MSYAHLQIFHGIKASLIEDIIMKCPQEQFAPWEVIMKKWDPSNEKWYIITSGKVIVYMNDENTVKLSKWDIFWEMALLSEEERSATVIAREATEALVLSQDVLLQIIQESDPTLCKDIMRRMEENLERE